MMDENLPEDSLDQPQHDVEGMNADVPAASGSSEEEEITQEVKLDSGRADDTGLAEPLEKDTQAEQADNPAEWVNELETFPDPDSDQGAESQGDDRDDIDGVPSDAGDGWWGGAPFLTLDALEDDETQPVKINGSALQDIPDEDRLDQSLMETQILPGAVSYTHLRAHET